MQEDGGPRKATAGSHGFRVFSSAVNARQVRRPSDVIVLVLSFLVTIQLSVAAPGPTQLDTAITKLLAALPGLGGWLWEFAYALLALWAVFLVLIMAVTPGRRRLLPNVALAALVAIGLAFTASLLSGTSWSEGWRALVSASSPGTYLAIRVAAVAAVVMFSSPHLSRPMRLVGRSILGLGAVSGMALGIANPLGVAAGLAVGIGSAAVAHLIVGSPAGRPTPSQVWLALAELDIEATGVEESPIQRPGVALFTATLSQNTELMVKVFGRDAYSTQLFGSIWRSLQNRDETPKLRTNRFQQVEHEAVATLLAERAGVQVAPVVAVGRSTNGDALLATQVSGQPLATIGLDVIDDQVLNRAWKLLSSLHTSGISHGQIDSLHVFLRVDGTPALTDLGDARIAPERGAFLADRARLLVTLALLVGHDRAVASAFEVVGGSGISEFLPFVQPAVLDHATRMAIKDGKWSLADLRNAAVNASGVDPAPLQKIRRVTARSIITLAVGAILAYFVISKLTNVDFASIWDTLSTAKTWWLLGALAMSPLVQVAYSASTLGASIITLRYVPVLMLQYAIQFIALVLPATAARLALAIRFFERFGLSAAAALSIGVIDSASGFAVQIALLLLITLTSLPGLSSGITTASTLNTTATSTGLYTLLLAIALLIIGAVISTFIPTLRHRLWGRIPAIRATLKEQASSARGSLVVLRDPNKVVRMLVGNLGAQLIQAVILGLCLTAFGQTAHLSQLILVNTAVSLFAGLMPVPGGVGVAEAGYTAGLQAIGVPSPIAISTAIAFRLATFYLPPLWGSFAMRWLRRNSYV
jgi:uncharacterized membrane protein YbhN (UPF0104 family)